LMNQYVELNRKTAETVAALIQSRDTFAAAEEPFPNYEVPVPGDSPLIGKSIGELKFWQSTGGTIVAIRRGQSVILSPGPYAELYQNDVIIMVGNTAAAQAARRFVSAKEGCT
jgi:K+/H+ antiporter YhaU regulatory subunit KhtT